MFHVLGCNKSCNKTLVPHRQISGGLGGVELQLQRVLFSVEGRDSLGPDGGDVLPLMELPVEGEDSVEVQSQTAAVIHHQSQFFPLCGANDTAEKFK